MSASRSDNNLRPLRNLGARREPVGPVLEHTGQVYIRLEDAAQADRVVLVHVCPQSECSVQPAPVRRRGHAQIYTVHLEQQPVEVRVVNPGLLAGVLAGLRLTEGLLESPLHASTS